MVDAHQIRRTPVRTGPLDGLSCEPFFSLSSWIQRPTTRLPAVPASLRGDTAVANKPKLAAQPRCRHEHLLH